MVRVAAARGYGGASVARVLDSAAASRSTFYAHFSTRDDCFVAAYRTLADRLRADLSVAIDRAVPEARLPAALAALLAFAAAEPASARYLFVEGLAGPVEAQAQHHRLRQDFDRVVAPMLAAPGPGSGPLQLPLPGVLGALDGALVPRLLDGDTASLPDLADDLLAWLESYRLPLDHEPLAAGSWARLGLRLAAPGGPPRDGAPRLLPRGRSALPAPAAASARRDRILAAAARLTAERGYHAMTVTDIVKAARVPRRTFYTLFESKRDAFRAALATGLQGCMVATTAEFFADAPWPERAWHALDGFLGYLASHPDLAYLGMVGVNAAGPEAVVQQHRGRMAFVHFLDDDAALWPRRRLPPLWPEAIAGALNELIRRHVVAGDAPRLREILPGCAYVVLAPLIGPVRATRFVVARARAARPPGRSALPRSPLRPGGV